MRNYKTEYFLLKHSSEKQIEMLKKRIRFLENKPERPKDLQMASLQEITKIVCDKSEVAYNDVMTNSRKCELVRARYIAYKIARELFRYTLNSIGLHFSKDHSTIIHGVNTITDWVDMNYQPELKFYNDSIKAIKAQYANTDFQQGQGVINLVCSAGQGKAIDCHV